MSSNDNKLSDLNREVADRALPAESVAFQSDATIAGKSAYSPAVRETGITHSANAMLSKEPDVMTALDDLVPAVDETSPSPSTTTIVAPPPAPRISAQETQTPSTSTTPFIGPVLGPTLSLYSPYIEDQRALSRVPNVFEKNLRNAIESRRHEDKSGSDEQGHEKGNKATSSNSYAPESDSIKEQTDGSVEEHGEKEEPTDILPETPGNNEEEEETSVEAHGSMKELEVSAEGPCNTEQGEVLVVEPCTIDKPDTSVVEPCTSGQPDTSVEAQCNKEDETLVEAQGSLKQLEVSTGSHCIKEQDEEVLVVEPYTMEQPDTSVEETQSKTEQEEKTAVPIETIVETEQSQEVETEADNSAPETQPADAETIAQAKEWHDSIICRVARLRGLSCWLGERNKRMDGMVEILVRSLEHMGVGAVTDHIGNLIPLQNFRLNSAIKLSSTDNTWTTCDEEIISNDINAWLPDSLPDNHNLPLTNEQMRKYETQVEALRAENESLQRSLQTALDNQGSLGVQINQWQACIDSAGQQLCRVTQEVHESKSRERHLRHLLGEERRIKDLLVQQNSATKAEQQDHTMENGSWLQNNDGMNDPSQSATSVTTEGATFVQGVTADRQHTVSNGVFNHYAGNSTQMTAKASPVTERPWQHRRGLSNWPRDTRSSRLNSSAPPFISAYSSPRRSSNRGNWHSGSDWHSRSGSGRHFGSSAGRGRHGGGRGHYRKEHSTNAGFNRLLDGFFDNLNRIESALRQQGINVPGPTSDSSQVVQQQQQQQQTVSNNVSMQYPTVQDVQQQQMVPNQPIYYSPPVQHMVYAEPDNTAVAQPVQSIPSMHHVPQSPTVVQDVQPHVQFLPVEGQAY